MPTPVRRSLISQASDILREELRKGTWPEFLPPERSLCEFLHISRPTLREALAIVEREQLIRKCHGQRTRVILKREKAIVSGPCQTVGFISSEYLAEMRQPHLLLVDELRRHLYDQNYLLELHYDSRLERSHPERFVQRICDQSPAVCWILLSQGIGVQRWFQDRAFKTVILGSCYKGIKSLSLDCDYHASYHHAVGTLIRMGHRRIILLMPKEDFAGNLAGESGLTGAVSSNSRKDLSFSIVHHNSTVIGIQRVLDALMQAPNRPTCILVSLPKYLLTVITHLSKMGVRIPEDVSLVCMDDDDFLNHLVPSIARYVISYPNYAKKLAKLVFQSITSSIQQRHFLLTPHFQTGASLAPRVSK